MPVLCCLGYYSFVLSFEIGKSSNFVFFSKIVLVNLGFLNYYMNFRITVNFYKKAAGILIGIPLNL